MQTKWTALSVLTLLIFISLVPLVASQGDGGGFWMWMPESITPAGHEIGWIFNLVLVITGLLFVDIHAIMIYFVIRYREKDLLDGEGTGSHVFLVALFSLAPTIILIICGYYLFGGAEGFTLYSIIFFLVHTGALYLLFQENDFRGEETSEVHGHLGIEITWTIIPTIIMIVLGIYSFEVYSDIVTPVDDPVHVQVTGLQFAWEVEYPEEDIEMNNQMVLPAGKPIQFHMNSPDVLHSFFVPAFRVKQDLVPGKETHLIIKKINKTGTYDIKCAELCGVGHYRMDGTLHVVSADQYNEFLSLESRGERNEFMEKVNNNE